MLGRIRALKVKRVKQTYGLKFASHSDQRRSRNLLEHFPTVVFPQRN